MSRSAARMAPPRRTTDDRSACSGALSLGLVSPASAITSLDVQANNPQVAGDPVADLVDPIPGSNFRNDSFLSLASDPRSKSTTLYAAWVNRTAADGSAGELVVYRTTGAGWTKVATPHTGSVTGAGVPFFQGLDVSSDGRVDLGWQALTAVNPNTFGTGNATINAYASSSQPGGMAFGAPTKVSERVVGPCRIVAERPATPVLG